MASYYISNVDGATGNTGLSSSQSWPQSKLSSFTFSAGDYIYLKKGETFTPLTFTQSGTAGNRITFDLYGTATNNAAFDGAGGSTSALYFNGCSYLNLNNLVAKNCSTACEAPFNLNNCHDITITNCYAGLGKRGMVLSYCTGNMVVTGSWFSKFTDAVSGTGPAAGGGSGIQWQHCSGSGNKVLSSKFYIDGSVTTNGVGDIISLWECYFGTGDVFSGVGSFGMEVAYNQLRGGSSSPAGYAAIVGGDVGGSNQYIHDNTACNTGKVGMQVQGGTNINMSNNIIYGGVFAYTSVGLSFGNYSGAACNNITMGGNKINFYSASNSGVYNKFFDQAITSANSTATGVPGGAALVQPTNWNTNTADHTADAAAYNALLADPLFADGDWNTSTGTAPVISYSPSTNVFTVGTAITNMTPANSGGAATSYSISQALPTGLNFSTSTGVISGTPTVTSASTSYTITGTNTFGSGTTSVTLSVLAASTNIVIKRAVMFR